jgi:hypothetical protein
VKHPKKKKIFSREEADVLVPELEKRLRLLKAKKESYSRTHDLIFMHELVCAAEKTNGLPDGKDDLDGGIHALEDAIEDLAKDVEAIFDLGCLLRDLEKGHVEFFGTHHGKEVYFSWHLGEPRVAYYRSLENHDRIPLSAKSLAQKSK